MTAFGSGQSVGGAESFFVGQLFPGHIIFGLVSLLFKEIAIPGHIADGLAHLGRRVAAQCLEELLVFVPQLFLDEAQLLTVVVVVFRCFLLPVFQERNLT